MDLTKPPQFTPEAVKIIDTLKEYQPNAGSADRSDCLPAWIESLTKAFNKNNGMTLSHGAVSHLLHTLICNHLRIERLIKERDNNV